MHLRKRYGSRCVSSVKQEAYQVYNLVLPGKDKDTGDVRVWVRGTNKFKPSKAASSRMQAGLRNTISSETVTFSAANAASITITDREGNTQKITLPAKSANNLIVSTSSPSQGAQANSPPETMLDGTSDATTTPSPTSVRSDPLSSVESPCVPTHFSLDGVTKMTRALSKMKKVKEKEDLARLQQRTTVGCAPNKKRRTRKKAKIKSEGRKNPYCYEMLKNGQALGMSSIEDAGNSTDKQQMIAAAVKRFASSASSNPSDLLADLASSASIFARSNPSIYQKVTNARKRPRKTGVARSQKRAVATAHSSPSIGRVLPVGASHVIQPWAMKSATSCALPMHFPAHQHFVKTTNGNTRQQPGILDSLPPELLYSKCADGSFYKTSGSEQYLSGQGIIARNPNGHFSMVLNQGTHFAIRTGSFPHSANGFTASTNAVFDGNHMTFV